MLILGPVSTWGMEVKPLMLELAPIVPESPENGEKINITDSNLKLVINDFIVLSF